MHKNPFSGKCIHGKDGAELKGAQMFADDCKRCVATLYPHHVKEPK